MRLFPRRTLSQAVQAFYIENQVKEGTPRGRGKEKTFLLLTASPVHGIMKNPLSPRHRGRPEPRVGVSLTC